MTASELIEKLQALVDEHGDLPVHLWPADIDGLEGVVGVRTGPIVRPRVTPRETIIIEGGWRSGR